MKNLVRAMEEAKEAGYWLVGLDERAEKSYTEVDLTGVRRHRAGQRRRGSARADAQALRFSGFASDDRAGALAECVRRRRRDALRSGSPAAQRSRPEKKGKQKLQRESSYSKRRRYLSYFSSENTSTPGSFVAAMQESQLDGERSADNFAAQLANSFIAAAAVPPVASRSSQSRTRWPWLARRPDEFRACRCRIRAGM